jgi:mono/diheme cytochrome c family protein
MWRRTAVLLALLPSCQPAIPPDSETPQVAAAAPIGESRDELLLASAKLALPPPGILAEALPDAASAGAAAVATHCAQCHELPTPVMHSANDWPGVLRRMWLRMDRLPASFAVAVPDAGTRVTMLNYMMANALSVTTANLPAGRGREEFAMICGRCHALPDVRVHAPEDWLAVILRMEQNMERMNVSQATPAETASILSYLQEVSGPR